MNLKEFRDSRIKGREELLGKIIKVFKQYNPVSIYQFGSGATEYKDEFSDLDIWVTFKDDEVNEIVKNKSRIFRNISDVLLRHYSKSWSPIGGSADLVIYYTKYSLFQVDYYISKFSKTTVQYNARVLFGSDLIKRDLSNTDNWILKRDLNESQTLKRDINLLLCLIFISIKGIIRKWDSPEFENTIKIVYKRIQDSSGKTKLRRIKLSFKVIYLLLEDLYPLSDNSQKIAIDRIRDYAKEVEGLYTKTI